jgi:N-(5-amino-5-carboxypentanoyl)-L-cysteinyl-D-valine synthase
LFFLASLSLNILSENEFKPFVTIENNLCEDNKAIVILFPPKFGGAETYCNNIVPKLIAKNIVLLNNLFQHALNNKIKMIDETYESLADYYFKQIKNIQNSGPYHLLGWSFGGILAIETARRLIENGDTVNSLYIIDSYFNLNQNTLSGLNEYETINESYKPKNFNFLSTIKNIAFYKADLCIDTNCEYTKKALNDLGLNENQIDDIIKISAFYSETEANNLDLLSTSNKERIEVIVMRNANHLNWINNQNILDELCKRFNEACLEKII